MAQYPTQPYVVHYAPSQPLPSANQVYPSAQQVTHCFSVSLYLSFDYEVADFRLQYDNVYV